MPAQRVFRLGALALLNPQSPEEQESFWTVGKDGNQPVQRDLGLGQALRDEQAVDLIFEALTVQSQALHFANERIRPVEGTRHCSGTAGQLRRRFHLSVSMKYLSEEQSCRPAGERVGQAWLDGFCSSIDLTANKLNAGLLQASAGVNRLTDQQQIDVFQCIVVSAALDEGLDETDS